MAVVIFSLMFVWAVSMCVTNLKYPTETTVSNPWD